MPAPITVSYAGTTLSSGLTHAIMQIYSKQIIFSFQPFCFFDQFTVKKTELGVLPGNTINFLKYANLTAGGGLTENVAISVQALSSSQIQLVVSEWGNAVSVSEFLLHSSFDDVMSSAAKLLGMDYAKVIDAALRDQVETDVSNVVFGAGATSLLTGGGFASTSILTTGRVKDGVETLKTANVPGIPEAGGSYVAIIHPHQARGLRDDSNWINASQYAGSQQIFNGEIGKYEDVRFVETTQCKVIAANARGSGDPFVQEYHGYLMGYNLLAHATALPVEMRDGGVIDFGRQHNLAYYAIEGYKCLQPESGVIFKTA